jgi:predicted membrane protein (TIGR00267 family)
LLERVVETICANKDVWAAVMMSEEHGLVAITRGDSARASAIVGVSSLVGAVVPVVPFALLAHRAAIGVSVLVGALSLGALGAVKARVTIGRPFRSGVVLAAIGLVSAFAGYVIGSLFG